MLPWRRWGRNSGLRGNGFIGETKKQLASMTQASPKSLTYPNLFIGLFQIWELFLFDRARFQANTRIHRESVTSFACVKQPRTHPC